METCRGSVNSGFGGIDHDWEDVGLVSSCRSTGSFSSNDSERVVIFEGKGSGASGSASVISDAGSDLETLSKTTCALMEPVLSMEQRLLDQIGYLVEDLDDAREKTRAMSLQNELLREENEQLKMDLLKVLKREGLNSGYDRDIFSSDLLKISLSFAAGYFLFNLSRKRLLINGVGILGAVVFGGCLKYFDPSAIEDDDSQPITI